MKIRSLLFPLLFLLPLCAAQAQQDAVGKLIKWFKAAEKFDYTYPREKVYLHLDNTSYLEGDTLWYKAYVLRASTLRPTTLSRVLYVDLLNADGQLVEKQLLQIDTLGQADGAFCLNLPIRAGFYELRAYTREMTNWGAAACFSRIVPVFGADEPNKGLDKAADTGLEQLSIPEPTENKRVTLGSPRPYKMQGTGKRLLTFYPEGGLRAKGLMQRVAYKLTDGRGNAAEDTVRIFSADGDLVEESVPEYDGMGTFLLPEDFTTGYAQISGAGLADKVAKERHALPAPEAAYVLEVLPDTAGLRIIVQANDSAATAAPLLGLAVLNRERACYFDTLTAPREATELFVAKSQLRTGVCRVELFDGAGRSLASRLVWASAPDGPRRKVRVEVAQNDTCYTPFQPAVVEMRLTDDGGRAVHTVVSVAVRDKAGLITAPYDGGIGAELLLSSEVRGYIHRPDLYFTKDDAAHRRMLDLLLMVQGWTAQRWEVMDGRDTFHVAQPIEDALTFRGRIFKDDRKHTPIPGQSLSFQGYSLTGTALDGKAVSDADGYFAFKSQTDFFGNIIAQFTTRNEEGKKRWRRVTLDRWFAPQPEPLSAPDLTLSHPTPAGSGGTAGGTLKPATFAWTDTIPHRLPSVLGTAEVKGRGKYHGFTGNRYTWGGGEKQGMKKATKFYNIEQLTEYLKDMGRSPNLRILELLNYFEGEFEFNHATYDPFFAAQTTTLAETNEQEATGTEENAAEEEEKTLAEKDDETDYNFRGRAVKIYLNNRPFHNMLKDYPELYGDMTMEGLKSGYLVLDNQQTDAISGENVRRSSEQYKLYLYEIPDFYRYKGKKGVDKRRIQGFTPKISFYAPDYRSFDLPDAGDLRRTLHWLPSLKTDAQGRAHFIFYTNARPQQWLDISIRGVTKEGRLVDYGQ